MLRPSWDEYFVKIANLTAERSNCIRRQVGCIIVKNNRIISTGMNGTPKGLINCFEGGCIRCNDNTIPSGELLEQCMCIHAEENAILFSDYNTLESSTLYCTHFPCLTCLKKILQVNIKRIVYINEYHSISQYFSKRDITFQSAEQLGIKIT